MIEKIKTVANLKEELKELNSKVKEISAKKYNTDAVQLMNQAFDEFGKWFSERGFTIKKENLHSSATFKTEKVMLSKNGQRDLLLSLSYNGKELGDIHIVETRKTSLSKGGVHFLSGSDELEREISRITQEIETAKRDLSKVNDLEFCYIISQPHEKAGKEYFVFTEILDDIFK